MKIICTIALAALLAIPALAQTGKVLDNLSVPSKLLKSDRKYAIYLPPDYGTVRLSFGRETSAPDVERAAAILIDAVKSLR